LDCWNCWFTETIQKKKFQVNKEKETKIFKNRFLLVLGVISILSVIMAGSYARPITSLPADLAGSDFYQRHPNWTWVVNDQNAAIPVTSDSAFPDYHQRHPELSVSSIIGLGSSDYFQRHPELIAPSEGVVDLTDYYFRLSAVPPAANVNDLTDYFFRHP
jgi:hypothetical protein